MRAFFVAAVLCIAPIGAGAALADAGAQPFTIDVDHHDGPLEGVVWHPASGGETSLYADNPVFKGVPIKTGASVRDGSHPVVLLSHGYGGHVRSLAWLGANLASQGAIVVSVNHPNSTWGDVDPRKSLDHGTRAQDLVAAFDWLVDRSDFSTNVDRSRVMAAGFSYGGWTALSLGGVRANLDGYAEHCREFRGRSALCADAISATEDFKTLDRDAWNRSYRHPDVTHVAAIDPALHWGVGDAELQNRVSNILLIGLGDGEDRLLATDFTESGSGFAALLTDARVEILSPATHFTALLECKEQGPAILEEMGDDPVCTDPPGSDRADIHALIIDLIATEFGL